MNSSRSPSLIQAAVELSLRQFPLFAQVVPLGKGEYLLEAKVNTIGEPIISLNSTVKADISWKLTDSRTKRVVWQAQTIKPFTATMSDSFVAVNRVRLADEGALRESIKAAFEEIGNLNL